MRQVNIQVNEGTAPTWITSRGPRRGEKDERDSAPDRFHIVNPLQGYHIVMFMCQIIKLCSKIGKKYPRKGNKSVILKDKNSKKIHNLHMATTNLNTHLWT